jgi:hypothetical protein
MKSRRVRVLPVVFLLSTGCGVGGFSGEPGSGRNAQRNNGLVVQTMNAEGINAAYGEEDQGTIYLQVRRGAPLDETLRQAFPDSPAYEMDIRVASSNGEVYFEQHGGAMAQDMSWDSGMMDLEWANEIRDSEDASRSMANSRSVNVSTLAERAIAEILRSASPAFQEEAKALQGFLSIVRDGADQFQQQDQATASESGDRAMASAPSNDSTYLQTAEVYYYEMVINILGVGVNVAVHHSGTRMISSSGSFRKIVSNCNHGGCPGNPAMKYKCTTTGVYRRSSYPSNGSCDWYSTYGFNPGHHECNDDSQYQVSLMRGRGIADIGTCRDATIRLWAPDC